MQTKKKKSKGISKSKIFQFKLERCSTGKPTQKSLAANTATAIKKQTRTGTQLC